MITAKEMKQMADKRNSTFSEQDECALEKVEKSIREAAENGWYSTTYNLVYIQDSGAKVHHIIKKLQENGYKVKRKNGIVNGWHALDYLQIDWRKN